MANSIDIVIPFEPHAGQLKILNDDHRFKTVACGRRWGKTTFIVILVMMQVAMNLQMGWGRDIALIFLSDGNSTPVWNRLKHLGEEIATAKDEATRTLRINDSFNIEFWSVEAIVKNETIRGRAYCLMVVDEAGVVNGLKAMWQALLFPTLTDYQGSAVFCGTPQGFNDFYDFFQLEKGEKMSKYWKSFTAWSKDNPHFSEEEWELAKDMYGEDSDYFKQEFKAEFVSNAAMLFNREDFPIIEKLPDKEVIMQVRYHDIANSKNSNKKGDYLSSLRLTVFKDDNNIYIDTPFREKGLWGVNYPKMKACILKEPLTIHYIEAEGIGSLAWEVIKQDKAKDLFGYDIRETNRAQFNNQSKYDRASRWALKASKREIVIVDSWDTKELLDQIALFTRHPHDDYVDNISGGVIALILEKVLPDTAKQSKKTEEEVKVESDSESSNDMTEEEIEALFAEMGGFLC